VTGRRVDPGVVGWRPLADEDLPLVRDWLNDDPVANRWYALGERRSLEAIAAEFSPSSNPGVRLFIITVDGWPVGVISAYRQVDHPDYWGWLERPDAAGLDLFIGDAAWRGRGVGTALLRRFLRDEIFSDLTTVVCIIDPDPANTDAMRVYARVGFRPFDPGRPMPDHLHGAALLAIGRDGMGRT
jgi:aminoglycoside 6'-N-acetyltransferase